MSSMPPDGMRKPILPASQGQTTTLDIHKDGDLPAPASEAEANALVAKVMAARLDFERRAGLSQWAQNEFLRCRNARQPFERQWYLNIAFYLGRQYVAPVFAAGQFKLSVPPAPRHRVRMVVNKIRPALRKEVAKLVSSKPIATVVPATSEDEDYAAANVAEAILKAHFIDPKILNLNQKWVWWGAVCGASFKKQFWDPNCLDYDSMWVPQPNQVQIPMGDSGQMAPPEIVAELFKMNPPKPRPARGKIKEELVSPFHLYVPDLLNDLESQPYVIHVMAKSPLWVKNKYPEYYPDGKTPICDALAEQSIMDATNLITKGRTTDQFNAVLVKEFWIKPNGHESFPNGGIVTVIGNNVVQLQETWPLPYPEYPFYAYNGIDTGGFYGDSVIVDLIPVQKEYNRKRSQMLEIQNTIGKPRIIYQEGSTNPRKWSSETGQSVPYKPGFEKPQIMDGAEVPVSMVNELENLKQEFDDISGQHEISRGNTPSQVTSGTAIAFLQEQDDSSLHTQVMGIEFALQQQGSHYLKLAANYWDDNRIVRVSGENLAYESFAWKKNVLRGNTDVKVQAGSGLPYSKAAKNAQVQELTTVGMIPMEQGLEMMSLSGFDKILDEMLVDKKQAMRENLKMADTEATSMYELLQQPAPGPNGEPVPPPFVNPEDGQEIPLNWDGSPFSPQPSIPVNSWDNHEEHIHWHNNFRKTQSFEVLPEANKKEFELHVQAHQFALTAQVMNNRGMMIQDNSGMSNNPPPVGPEEDAPEEENSPNESAPPQPE